MSRLRLVHEPERAYLVLDLDAELAQRVESAIADPESHADLEAGMTDGVAFIIAIDELRRIGQQRRRRARRAA